ncbi:MAG: hypothetical protein WCW14_04320 [Candidatus Paceibacterota bacterium]|jgi:hypothetical protein
MIISSTEARILIDCPDELVSALAESSFLENYIPEVKIEIQSTSYDHKLTLLKTNADQPHFDFSHTESVLSGKLGTSVNIKDIVTVIDHCLEYVRQSKSIYCIHGSAVSSTKNCGVVFFGPVSGLGKTTLALNLCLKRDFSFIGDEKILLDRDRYIIGGAKRIAFNKSVLHNSVGTDLDDRSLDELSQKIRITTERVQIKLLVLPMLFPSSTDLEVDEWDQSKANFHIYEELTRKIRGTSRRIQNFSYPLPSLDSEKQAVERSEYAHLFSENCQTIYLKGGQNNILDYITNLLDRSC